MYTVIGLAESSGEYNGVQYDNIIMYLTYESEKVAGVACKVEKIKRKDFNEDVEIGDQIELLYNQYGKVSKVFISAD